eukprot:TRINITY_DN19453_c0_g1_i2.p1 TRINITY_DN19453_c0_g1~~TRINITY_DN19453_c0_g1_i2.p1  ORF type:complete len:174 (-),score=40.62 TRINITY_DN19453_c0_g1_i2:207-728(-)
MPTVRRHEEAYIIAHRAELNGYSGMDLVIEARIRFLELSTEEKLKLMPDWLDAPLEDEGGISLSELLPEAPAVREAPSEAAQATTRADEVPAAPAESPEESGLLVPHEAQEPLQVARTSTPPGQGHTFAVNVFEKASAEDEFEASRSPADTAQTQRPHELDVRKIIESAAENK